MEKIEYERIEDEENILKKYRLSEGLSSAEARELLRKYGRNEVPEGSPRRLKFLSIFWGLIPCMIWVAAILEVAISNYYDMAVLILINFANAGLRFYKSSKIGDAVAALKASLRPTAVCFRDGRWETSFDARLLVPGDLIELAAGSAVPADCLINSGTIDVDESALTGESLPVTLHEREIAKMGGVVARGETQATVVLTGKHTFFGKTASLLPDSSDLESRTNFQKIVIKIILILFALCLLFVICAFTYFLVKVGESGKASVSFAAVLIVTSIPLAIEIIPTTILSIGSKILSRGGVIVNRLSAIEDLAGVNMLCSDKTGTLTKNKIEIQDDAPTYEQNVTQMDLLKYAALAAKWECEPKDALETLILRCHLWYPGIKDALKEHVSKNPDMSQTEKDDWYNHEIYLKVQEALKDYESLAYIPFDPRVKRTESTIRVSGTIFKVTKGAPHILQSLDKDEEKGHKIHETVLKLGEDGIRAIAIAISDPINDQWKEGVPPEEQHITPVWHVIGMLTLLDPPRDDTKDAIARSQDYGVPVRMITGDNILVAKKTCRDLKMGNLDRPEWPFILGPDKLPMLESGGKPSKDLVKDFGESIRNADGFAQVFPEHKFLIVKTFRQLGYKCGMTGDGVGDAPVLKRADVGIAVAGATDAARAAADIVLTKEGLSTIIFGIEQARCIFSRMKSFLTYRIAATLQLLTFFFIAVFAFNPRNYAANAPDGNEYPGFFSLPVLFLILITLINDGTLISIGYDNAVPSKFPERWILPVIFIVALTLAVIPCVSTLLLLYLELNSHNPDGLFQKWGIGGLTYGQIVISIYLKVAVSDILTLFSSRTAQQFFFQRKPHPVLLVCALFTLCLSTMISLVIPCGSTFDNVPICGLGYNKQKVALWIWIYCIIVFLIQDIVKVAMWRVIIYFNFYNVNNVVE